MFEGSGGNEGDSGGRSSVVFLRFGVLDPSSELGLKVFESGLALE